MEKMNFFTYKVEQFCLCASVSVVKEP